MGLNRKISPKFSLLITAIFFLGGLFTFIGYWVSSIFHYEFPGLADMNPVTALCFILAGIWLFLYQKQSKLARTFHVYVFSLILLCGICKILEYTGLFHVDYDRFLFFGILNSNQYFRPLAPNSTFLLLLCGVVILTSYCDSKKSKLVNDIVRVMGFLISYLAIIGYIFNLEIAYKIGDFIPLAVGSAIGYMAFFTVSLIELPPGGLMNVINSDRIGGRLARRAIPLILLIPLIFGYLRLIGEKDALYDPIYGTALETAFMVFLVLVFVFIYARRLNQQDNIRSEAELLTRESEEKYRTLVNALREGVVYYDVNGIVSFCNKSFSTLTGYLEDEIKGKSIFELFIDDDLKEKYKKRLVERGVGVFDLFEENIKTSGGSKIWVSISASPVFNDEGEIIAALSTVVDITERKKQIEDIEAFSASAAHDLNAPLARIEMIALLLIDSAEDQLDPENVELLEAIAGITSNMRALLKDLLQFSKLGITGVIKNTVNTKEIVSDVLAVNRSINPKAIVKCGYLPDVKADKAMLKQVFTNLISNALKYSSQVEQPRVEIGYIEEPGKLIFYIKDNGAGFDMADAPKLFAAFQRLHIEFEGNGMGLPIVKRIIEKHGGKIWANSKPREGATFYFTLN